MFFSTSLLEDDLLPTAPRNIIGRAIESFNHSHVFSNTLLLCHSSLFPELQTSQEEASAFCLGKNLTRQLRAKAQAL
jgi:hypothetical protein